MPAAPVTAHWGSGRQGKAVFLDMGFWGGGFIYFWVWGVVEPLLALVLGFSLCVCLEFLFGFLSAVGPHLGFSPFLQKLPLL